MKYEANNVTVQLGLYGSCVNKNFASINFESLGKCASGGLITGFGNSGTKFLAAMHPIALILSFVLVIVGLIAIIKSESGMFQNILVIISIIGSIVILLAVIGDILAFKDSNSQLIQFQQNVKSVTSGSGLKTSFGPGFGFAIVSLILSMIIICLSCRSRNLTIKVKQKGCCS